MGIIGAEQPRDAKAPQLVDTLRKLRAAPRVLHFLSPKNTCYDG